MYYYIRMQLEYHCATELHKHISWADAENNPQEKAAVEHINGSFINSHITFDSPLCIWCIL